MNKTARDDIKNIFLVEACSQTLVKERLQSGKMLDIFRVRWKTPKHTWTSGKHCSFATLVHPGKRRQERQPENNSVTDEALPVPFLKRP